VRQDVNEHHGQGGPDEESANDSLRSPAAQLSIDLALQSGPFLGRLRLLRLTLT